MRNFISAVKEKAEWLLPVVALLAFGAIMVYGSFQIDWTEFDADAAAEVLIQVD